jgi:hypothetical protein
VDRKQYLRFLGIGAIVFAALVLLPVLWFALYYRVVPNIFEAPIQQLWQLSSNLFSSNPGAALRLVVYQPLAVVGYIESGTGLRVWEVYAYPIPALVLLAGVTCACVIAARGDVRPIRLAWISTGVLLVTLAVSYVRVAACCTGPGWVIDVSLRALALIPSPGGQIDWPALYQRIEALLLPVQVVLVAAGVAIMTYAARRGSERD